MGSQPLQGVITTVMVKTSTTQKDRRLEKRVVARKGGSAMSHSFRHPIALKPPCSVILCD
jgi:hypothetical protein